MSPLARCASSLLASFLVVACCGAPPANDGTMHVYIGRDANVRDAVMAAIGPGTPSRSVVLFGLDSEPRDYPSVLDRAQQLGEAIEACGYRWYQEREMLLRPDIRIGIAMREPKLLESASLGWTSWARIKGQLWAHGIEFACDNLGGNSPVVYVPSDQLDRAEKLVAGRVGP